MTTDYRLTSDADREAFYQLYQYAFNNHDTPARRRFFMDRYQHGWIYGRHDHGQLVSGLYSLPLAVNFHGVTYRMNGIGDVMSAPEYAGQGGAGQLLTTALTEMAANHVTLSYLAPFAYGYYRRFGYEHVFDHAHQVMAAQTYHVSNRRTGLVRSPAMAMTGWPKSTIFMHDNRKISVVV
ncbi:GNAT family N-acetyltransferase [Lactiplantibacillus plantarum]|uniref:GNAT family N-acetyltransferase n=1 Tax=Lactiplantibacillus plantarum TaxID=1590 RepID=UPI001EE953E8|nr:GNAT family N-acetyltransferase [Lactiplantibacillus plantarum]